MDRKYLIDFDLLVEKHSREIFSYLWRMLRDPQDAEDALQATFIRAFQGFPRLQNTANLRAWLYKIATNVAYTQYKRSSRYTSRITEFDDKLEIATPDPYELQDFFEAVLQKIEKLPYKQKVSLILRNYEGLNYEEIAMALNCSSDSARANVYQALKKLRRQFREADKL